MEKLCKEHQGFLMPINVLWKKSTFELSNFQIAEDLFCATISNHCINEKVDLTKINYFCPCQIIQIRRHTNQLTAGGNITRFHQLSKLNVYDKTCSTRIITKRSTYKFLSGFPYAAFFLPTSLYHSHLPQPC